MSYSTLDDLKKLIPEEVLIQLTDDEATGAIVVARVTEAIAQADAEIDSYCGTRYAVPFIPVPEIIRKCSVDMAVYNLYSRRVEELPGTRVERYKNAIRRLEGMARGTISIGTDPPSGVPTGGDRIDSTRGADDRAVTRTGMKGF